MKQINYLSIICMSVLLFSCSHEEKTNPVRKDIEKAVFSSGHIEQENEYIVSAVANGVIDSLFVKEGDRVDANNVIALLQSDVQNTQLQDAQAMYEDAKKNAAESSPQLSQLQAQINQAKEQHNLDRTNYERYKDLRAKNSISQLDFDKAELQYKTSQENLNVLEKRYKETKNALELNADRSRIQVNKQLALLKDYCLTADISGEVTEVYKKRGELIRAGEAVAKIGSGAYIIKLYVSEDDINAVEIGQSVAVHLNTYPNDVFMATVSKILPSFNGSVQSYEVEALFEATPPKLFPGTQLQANIKTQKQENVLVIPVSYLVKGKYVIMKDKSQRAVVVGGRNQEWVEIISGITENDVIIKK